MILRKGFKFNSIQTSILNEASKRSANPLVKWFGNGLKSYTEGVSFFPMPKLAPIMINGKISKWLKKEGEAISTYDLLANISTDNLVEEGEKIGKFKGEVCLEVEAQEDAYLAKILHPESSTQLPVGTPIAILCDEEDKIKGLQDMDWSMIPNLYSENLEKEGIIVASWQAYLIENIEEDASNTTNERQEEEEASSKFSWYK